MYRTTIALVIVAVVAAALACPRSAAVTPTEPPAKKETAGADQPPPGGVKLPTRKEAMAMKLKATQAILEGISLYDFAKVEAAADNLIAVSDATTFLNAYKGAEYQFHVELIRRPADTILRRARSKNMDGVMLAYNDLTLSCLKCHQAMRDKKFEVLHKLDQDREQ